MLSPDYPWYGAGNTNWESIVTSTVNPQAVNTGGGLLQDKRKDQRSMAPSLHQHQSQKQDQGQGNATESTITLQPEQSPRVHSNAAVISKIQEEQSIRRREQNRKSQRAYRDRRTQYASSLESKVEEMKGSIQLLQTENRELLQRLCELRSKNNVLRSSGTASSPSNSFPCVVVAQSPAGSQYSGDQPLAKEELESLYEPYLAIWNLLSSHLEPDSQPEDFVAVLEHLQTMALRKMRIADQDETEERG